MGEMMYTRNQLEEVIQKTVVMTKDFLSDSDMNGKDLYEKHKDHFKSFIIPQAVTLQEAVLSNPEEGKIISHYPSWQEEEPEHPWHDKVAKKLCSSLSETQRVILKTILVNDNHATHDTLRDAIVEAGINWTNNLTLGGSLGGLSRKCVYRYETPYVYGWNEDDDSYFIVPEALQFIQKHLA